MSRGLTNIHRNILVASYRSNLHTKIVIDTNSFDFMREQGQRLPQEILNQKNRSGTHDILYIANNSAIKRIADEFLAYDDKQS